MRRSSYSSFPVQSNRSLKKKEKKRKECRLSGCSNDICVTRETIPGPEIGRSVTHHRAWRRRTPRKKTGLRTRSITSVYDGRIKFPLAWHASMNEGGTCRRGMAASQPAEGTSDYASGRLYEQTRSGISLALDTDSPQTRTAMTWTVHAAMMISMTKSPNCPPSRTMRERERLPLKRYDFP